MIDFLPTPSEAELNDNKVNYFERIISLDLEIKYKIELTDLFKWIHLNYQSVFLYEKELSYKDFRKITK
jgi:hypothetical protein